MDLGPLEIFYCWQSLVLSCGVHVGTRSMKSAFILAAKDDKVRLAWAKEVAIPLIPIVLGTIAGIFVPLRPEFLENYLKVNEINVTWPVHAAYGASIGTFADYIHQRIAGVLKVKNAHTKSE